MKILIIGSGGREHALVWKIKQSPKVEKIYCAPGNGGIAQDAECLEIVADDIDGLKRFAKTKKIDLTIVGPEAPLVGGIVDAFTKEGLKIFGPTRAAAQLEGSKVFAKEFLNRWNIPTAAFQTFDNLKEAKDFLDEASFPIVIKAEGLAAGKGVFICDSIKQAREAVDQIMTDKVFKDAGKRIVMEEFLEGMEASILVISDGESYVMLEPSQDHKRIFDDDLGPNTGGMGAYSPTPFVNTTLLKKVESRIVEPTIRGMSREKMPFRGVLYVGLMITSEGPKVLEFNVRFGDPEAQVILPRLKTDLVDVMLASCEGRLKGMSLGWDRRACVCVVMSSGGYPGKYQVGYEITGLKEAGKSASTFIFHAGTGKKGTKIVTSGGRVLGVTALGDGIEQAIDQAYEAVEKIKFEHCFFRRDIAAKALKQTTTTAAQPGSSRLRI